MVIGVEGVGMEGWAKWVLKKGGFMGRLVPDHLAFACTAFAPRPSCTKSRGQEILVWLDKLLGFVECL